MENKFWFEMPTQVRCFEFMEEINGVQEPQFFTGIAYHDQVICACCGAIFDIDEIYAIADEDHFAGEVIKPLGDWVDFSDYIVE